MLHIYCPVCHGKLELKEAQNEAVCLNCGSLVSIPKGYTELESIFNYASEARIRRDFDVAEQTYTEILKKYPQNSEALWGRAVSRYGIEYQPIDEVNYRLVCHRAMDGDFLEDADVHAALETADQTVRERYREEAQKISELQAEVVRVVSVTEPCDVLILGSDGKSGALQRTERLALMAKAAGKKVSKPSIDLAGMSEKEWEPYLYHAFETAEVLVIAAAGAAAFTPELIFDVKRFERLKISGERAADKRRRRILLVFEDLDEYEDIPDEIFESFDRRLSITTADFAAVYTGFLNGENEDYDQWLRKEAAGGDYQYINQLRQAKLALEKGEFKQALLLYDEILTKNPKESQAYWGELLGKNHCRSEQELIDRAIDISNDSSCRTALAFASEREQQIYRAVMQKAAKQRELRDRQRAEEERLIKKREEERKKHNIAVESDRKKKRQEEERAAERSYVLVRLFGVLLGALVLAGGIGYCQYEQTTGAKKEAYKKASKQYSAHNYWEAAEGFLELGDYEDSARMYEQSMNMYYIDQYHVALNQGADLEERTQAIKMLQEIQPYVVEAQQKLEEWYEEGMNYYEQGRYIEAYHCLTGFDVEVPEYGAAVRKESKASAQPMALSDNFEMIAVNADTGHVSMVNCNFEFPEELPVQFPSISSSGKSAAVVYEDGSICLAGTVAQKAEVSGWSQIKQLFLTDETVIGLTEEGILKNSQGEVLAEQIRQFSAYKDTVVGCRLDGTVFSTDDELQTALAGWKNICSIAVGSGKDVIAVDEEGVLYAYNCEYAFPEEGVQAVFSQGGAVCLLTDEGRLHESSYQKGRTPRWKSVKLLYAVKSQCAVVGIDKNDKSLGDVWGNVADERGISLRAFVSGRVIRAK